MSNHRAGGKITRSHTTLIDAAVPLVDLLQARSEVSKISLGIIKNIGKGMPKIKLFPVTGGLKIVVRGNTSLQELVAYTNNKEVIRQMLESYQI